MSKKPINGDQPATQADLSILAGEMTTRFDLIDTRLERMESSQNATLELVKGIDQQLKEWQHIPAKVERLHKRAFGTHD